MLELQRVGEVFLQRSQYRGVPDAFTRPPSQGASHPSTTLPFPVDRSGERLAACFRDASLQVQVSDDVRHNRLHEHGLASLGDHLVDRA
jgi:hypothetical protein